MSMVQDNFFYCIIKDSSSRFYQMRRTPEFVRRLYGKQKNYMLTNIQKLIFTSACLCNQCKHNMVLLRLLLTNRRAKR